jgi:CrcB protein
MTQLFLVGAGGFLGSVLRYLIGGLAQQSALGATYPLGTFVVNLIGCLIIGILAQLAEGRVTFTAEARAFLFVGVLGGFTTFSSFGNETIELWRADKANLAMAHVAGHFVVCLGAVCVGRALGQWGR